MNRRQALTRFYEILEQLERKSGGKRRLDTCTGRMDWPQRGVYFFFEPGENRSDSGSGPRVVRVGTHALTGKSRTTLWNRLSQHQGTLKNGGGNHRGSIFRLHVGTALLKQGSWPEAIQATWGKGSSASAAVRQGRSLLTNPDPVEPLLKQTAGALRSALQKRRAKLSTALNAELDGLQATMEWQKLGPDERQQILSANHLGPVADLQIGTDAELLRSLEAGSLTDWDNRISALPGRVQKARETAIQLTTPKAVTVTPPHATLSSAAEVDAYLEGLRVEIMKHVSDGKPVIL